MTLHANFKRCPSCGHEHTSSSPCVVGVVPQVQSFPFGLGGTKAQAAKPGVVCLGHLPNQHGTDPVPANAGGEGHPGNSRTGTGTAAPKGRFVAKAKSDDTAESVTKPKVKPRGRPKKK